MAITFTSGGFAGNIRSDASGNIFVETQGNAKEINLGGLFVITGSTRKILNPADGSVKVQTTYNPATGIDTLQSGSATNNQIQFIQTPQGNASIILSGSDPRFSIERSAGPNAFSSIRRAQREFYQSGSVKFGLGLDQQGNYFLSPADSAAGVNDAVSFIDNPPYFMVSQSGDVVIQGGKLIAEEYVVSSSVTNFITLAQSGSTKFGDTAGDDTHQFTGSVNVSGSLTVNGNTPLTSITVGTGLDISSPTAIGRTINLDLTEVIASDAANRVLTSDGDGTLTGESNLTFDGNDLSVGRDINLARTINHTDDGNTSIGFDTDTINFSAGGSNQFTLQSGHITASGNISASGVISASKFRGDGSGLTNVTATTTLPDGLISSSLQFGSSDNVNFNNITASGNISASGELSANTIIVGSTISHIGDTNTLISFGTDTLTFKAGNESFITITEDGSQDNIVIGDGGDIDFHVKAGGNNTLFVQGSSQRVGIGLNSPSTILHVKSDDNQLARFESNDDDAKIVIKDNDTTGFHNVRDGFHSFGFDGFSLRSPLFVVSGSQDANGVHGKVGIGTKDVSDSVLTVLGDISASGELKVESHITASGNISCSGHIRVNEIRDNFNSSTLTIRPDGKLNLGTAATDEINIGRQSGTCDIQLFANTSTVAARFVTSTITFNHPITASGDISSSGTIIGNIISGSTISGSFKGDGSALSGITSTVPAGTISGAAQLPSGIFSASAAGSAQGKFKLNGVDVDVNGLGTDGDVTFDTLTLDVGGLKGVGAISSSAQFGSSDNVNFNHITASGNISSSHTGSFGKMTIGTSTTAHPNTQLTIIGGTGGNDIAKFTRNAAHGAAAAPFVAINANSADPQIRFFEGTDQVSIGQDASNSNLVFATGSKIVAKEAMVIDTSGKVGIGTVSPGEKLEVIGNISASGIINSSTTVASIGNLYQAQLDNGTTAGPRFNLGSKADPDSFLSIQASGGINKIMTLTRDFHIFGTNTTTGFYLDEGLGNFGIKTLVPSASLDVNGNFQVQSHITASGNISASGANQTIGGLSITPTLMNYGIDTSGDTTVRFSTDGDAGDDILLQLYRNDNAFGQIHYEPGGGNSSGLHITDFRDDANSHIIFNTRGDNERMRIEGDGGVSFQSHITASGDISSSGTIISNVFNAIQGTNAAAQGLRFDNRTDQGIFGHGFFTSIMAPESVTIHIDSNGNGTTEYFNVVKDQKLIASTTNELFRVQEDGNVGIGTSSPVTKLQVAGNISSSGAINTLSHITASGFISASGDGNHFIGGKINLNSATPANQEIKFGGAARIQGNNTFLILDSDDQFVARADNKMNFNTPLFGLGGFDTNDTPSATLHISGAGDTRLFVEGNITASGNISASGTIVANELQDTSLTENRLALVGANGVLTDSSNFTVDSVGTTLNVLVAKTQRGMIVNEAAHSTGDFRVEGGTDTHLLFADASADKVAIGTDTVGDSLLTIDGDVTATHITASGNISASVSMSAAAFSGDGSGLTNVTATLPTGIVSSSTQINSLINDTIAATIVAEIDNDEIPIAKLAEDAITIAGTSTALGGSITADTIAAQISNDTISGNQINGGTIGSTTITALAGNLSLGDNSISNVGSIQLDSIEDDATGGDTKIEINGTTMNIDVGSATLLEATATTAKFSLPIETTSHITASGNISSSGAITANDPTITYASASIVTLANGEGYGEIIDLFPAHGSVNAGDVVFHLGSTGTVWRTGTNSADYSVNMAGVALQDGDGSTPCRVLTRGVVRLAAGHIQDTSGTDGEPLYSGDTAGHVQFAAPGSANEYARIIGYCLVEDDDIIYFNPDNTYVKRSS